MEFKEGTPVYTAEGQKVGDIERFVLDPSAQQIIGLVVRKGLLLTVDRVIPIKMVGTAEEDRVVLYADAGDPEDFPPFEETHYISPDESEVTEVYQQQFFYPVYYYPPVGTPVMHDPGFFGPRPAVKERHIPEGTVPVKEGAKVITRDGVHVGDVERVFTDAKSDKITHFSISQGMLFKEEKLVPANWVDTANEEDLQLAVGKPTLERLGKI